VRERGRKVARDPPRQGVSLASAGDPALSASLAYKLAQGSVQIVCQGLEKGPAPAPAPGAAHSAPGLHSAPRKTHKKKRTKRKKKRTKRKKKRSRSRAAR
jgi:hypothetical protein